MVAHDSARIEPQTLGRCALGGRSFIARQGDGYDLSLAGPFRNRSANMQLHVLNAKLRPLKKTLSHYLKPAEQSGVTYVPFGDRVIVTCADIADGRAGDEGMGSSHEVSVSFFILALRCNPLPSAVVGFNPYLFVNHSWAMVLGREIHGFRKDIATSFSKTIPDVDGPAWKNRARDIEHVEAFAMDKRAHGSRLQRMKLFEIRHHADESPLSEGGEPLVKALIGSGPNELFDQLPPFLTDKLAKLDDLKQMLRAFVRGPQVHVPSVFLRQFRDPRNSANADVQEVLEAESIGTPQGAPKVLRPSEIRLHHAASHPIADELGLESGKWLRADLSMEVNMDFVLNDAA
jgi:hypothetical protein